MRSRLLFEAQRQVSNPFLLCALISGRTRQLMMCQNGHASTADLVDYALNELIVGALEFKMPGEKQRRNEEPAQHDRPAAAPKKAIQVEATRGAGSKSGN